MKLVFHQFMGVALVRTFTAHHCGRVPTHIARPMLTAR